MRYVLYNVLCGGSTLPGFVFTDDDKCNRCGLCIPKCPVDAISSVRDRIVASNW
jgi:ferredoxin